MVDQNTNVIKIFIKATVITYCKQVDIITDMKVKAFFKI